MAVDDQSKINFSIPQGALLFLVISTELIFIMPMASSAGTWLTFGFALHQV